MPTTSSLENAVDALLRGQSDLPFDLLAPVLPGGNVKADAALATLFWSRWQRQSGLHPEFMAALEPLPRALEKEACERWIASASHPLWNLLVTLQNVGIGYQPDLGRAGEKLLADLQTLWAPLRDGDWIAAAAQAQTQWQQEQQRVARSEQRLIDSERGQLRNRRARQLSALVLNRALAGKRLSAAMQAYMHEAWFRELQWCVLQFGERSSEWQHRVDLTGRLIESLQESGDDAEQRQRLYALIPEISAELRETLSAHAPETNVLDQQLALIESHHLALLKGRPLEASSCKLIANDNPWTDATTTLSRDLLQQAAKLEPGAWFLWRGDSNEARIKLILKMDDTAQLLFVNRLGVKALQKSFEEFAYSLAIDAVEPLPRPDNARNALRQLLTQLLQRATQRQQAHADDERRLAEERRRADEEEQRRRAAHEKAMVEAAALAQARAEAERLARLETERVLREQEQQRRQAVQQAQAAEGEQRARNARQTAALIAVGSWVEFHDETGNAQRLKLAVKLPSSGKMIFVDREGIRRAEFERDVFLAKLLEGSARALDSGPQFEDTLARVVSSLRRERNKE